MTKNQTLPTKDINIEEKNTPIISVPNRRENGTFGPGNNANPKGRPPKGWSWSELLEDVGEEIEPDSGRKFKELVSKRLWYESVNGNILAIRDLMNRMDGFPAQSVDQKISGDLYITRTKYGDDSDTS